MKVNMSNEIINELSSKQITIKQWSEWFDNLGSNMDLFAVTVVFRAGGDSPNSEQWLSEYRRVLRKFDKRLAPHNFDSRKTIKTSKRQSLECRNQVVRAGLKARSDRLCRSICSDLLSYYEHSEVSWFKSLAGMKPVHHVHGVVGIPKNLTPRIWNCSENGLKFQMEKDLLSMDIISSVLFEPLRIGEAKSWLGYIAKKKSFYGS
jgi:hypothetical protein